MRWSDPAVIAALAAAAGMLLAELRQMVFGRRRNKADLAEIEQRIAEGLLTRLEKRLADAEAKIAELERQVRDLRTDRDRLERELAVVTAERDALLVERADLLNRISVLTPPT